MKFPLLAAFASAALLCSVGCSMYTKTQYAQYRGPDEFQGTGGTVRQVDGIDVWESGTPDRKCKILGLITQTHYDNHSILSLIAGASKDSAIIKEAKARGGDAIILIADRADIVGWTTHASVQGSQSGTLSGYQSGNTYTGTYQGSSSATGTAHTSANTQSGKILVVVKYLK